MSDLCPPYVRLPSHRRALYSAGVTFRSLSSKFAAMEATESAADRMYRAAITSYPYSTKLKRAYAGFLQEVRVPLSVPFNFHCLCHCRCQC